MDGDNLMTDTKTETFEERLNRISSDIELGMECSLIVGISLGRFYFQIQCWRKDAITGEMGMGYGGKAYLSPFMSDSEIIQVAFGLYKGYWEHEARETFVWRKRRIFGPHIKAEALWEIARKVDLRSAQHVEDKR